MKVYICEKCGKEFTNPKLKANHVRWNHNDNTSFIRKIKDIKKKRDIKHLGNFKFFTVECHKCKTTFNVREREHIFPKKKNYYCGSKCSHSRNHSEETKKKISETTSKTIRRKLIDDPAYYKRMISGNTKRRYTSKNEELIRDHFIRTFEKDEWTFGILAGRGKKLISCDLFSRKLKICFEYDGVWHFKDIHGQLADKIKRDQALEQWCDDHNWRLIRMDEEMFDDESLLILENIFYEQNDKILKIGNRY